MSNTDRWESGMYGAMEWGDAFPDAMPDAVYVDWLKDLHGFPYVYATCSGCEMAYELNPETGELQHWNEGVGLEVRTTLQSPNDWLDVVNQHHDCPAWD